MILYRCGLIKYLDMSGVGSFLFDGRFHNKGRHLVYLSENAGSAMLETLVRLIPRKHNNTNQEDFGIADIFIHSKAKIYEPELKNDWQSDQLYTRSVGSKWFDESKYELMKVPSIVIPNTFNYLLNITMINNKLAYIKNITSLNWDKRLL